MSARFCAFCGRPLPVSGTFCPSCGARRADLVAPPGGPSPLPFSVPGAPTTAPPPYGTYPGAGRPSFVDPATERHSLYRVELAALVALVAAVLGIGVDLATGFGQFIRVTATPSGSVLSLPSPWLWVVLVGSDGALGLTELWLLRVAFRDLSRGDLRFSTPAALAFVAIIGVVFALVGLTLLLEALYAAVQCAGAGNPITSACLARGVFWAGVAVVAIGAVVALVGFVGTLVGIWRLGTRFNDGRFKVGAVLTIFPILNIVAAVLILIAARAARNVGPAPPAPTF